jgi:hypothetical protein
MRGFIQHAYKLARFRGSQVELVVVAAKAIHHNCSGMGTQWKLWERISMALSDSGVIRAAFTWMTLS